MLTIHPGIGAQLDISQGQVSESLQPDLSNATILT
jgi:hypothetical protein